MRSGVRAFAGLTVSLVLAAGCGLKSGVWDPGAIGRSPEVAAPVAAPATTPDAEVAAPAVPGTAPTTVTSLAVPSAGSASGVTARPPVRQGGAAPVASGTRPSPRAAEQGAPTATALPAANAAPAAPAGNSGSAPAAVPGDSNGVTETEIVIGVHGPVTGAAPIPQQSVDKAKDVYWKWLAEHGGVAGRNVRVVFRDDQYNPSRAIQVCREMVEQEKVFLLVGLGADQITPCARYADQVRVPYLAAGAGEEPVAGLGTYFALSMSYPQQAPMVAQVVKRAGKIKVGIVVADTPNYEDTFRALQAEARKAGLQIVRASRTNKSPSQSETLAEANALRVAGAEAVILMMAPLAFVNLAHSAQGQAYNPLWVGPGVSNGLNLVAEFGCPSINGARFLSPFPQLDVIDRFDPDYRVAYRKYNKEEGDDLGLLVWGLEKTLKLFLEATGRELTRSRFLATLTSGREFVSAVLPPLRYGPGQRFGALQANLLEADCQNRRYKTLATFSATL